MMNPAGFFVCLKKSTRTKKIKKSDNQWNQQNMDSRGRVWETEVGLGKHPLHCKPGSLGTTE